MYNTISMKYDDKLSYLPNLIDCWNLGSLHVIHSSCKVFFPLSEHVRVSNDAGLALYLKQGLYELNSRWYEPFVESFHP